MNKLLAQANKVFEENFPKETWFERALFFSWYCSRGDCKFCYMSTQKNLISNPKKAKRTKESIIAEIIICTKLGWKIEFISGGYKSFEFEDLVDLIKIISEITGKKQWLNLGVMPESRLERLKPYIEGFCGAVECVNPEVHDFVCPSKPINEIEKMYSLCDKHGLKKAMTIIIGLGEKIDDFKNLKKFIEKNKIDRITFYSLNPQKGTIFKKSPELDYYAEWIARTRIAFPKLNIIAGAWIDKPQYFSVLLKAGANAITKIPALKTFGNKNMKLIEKTIEETGRTFRGTLTKMPKDDWDKEIKKLNLTQERKELVKTKLEQYLKTMTN